MTKDPSEMSTHEIMTAIGGAERVLAALRAELESRVDKEQYCGHCWSKFTCKLKPGHQGRHSQGFIMWSR
jgi:hypothetical protein